MNVSAIGNLISPESSVSSVKRTLCHAILYIYHAMIFQWDACSTGELIIYQLLVAFLLKINENEISCRILQ